MIWYNMIWYAIIWYNLICYDMILYNEIWYDMIWYYVIWRKIYHRIIWIKQTFRSYYWLLNLSARTYFYWHDVCGMLQQWDPFISLFLWFAVENSLLMPEKYKIKLSWDIMWCDVIWCDMIYCDEIWYDMMWYDVMD